MEFNYFLPVNLVFGRGSVSKVGIIASDYGKCALIVTGKSSTKKSGLLDRVINYLEKSGIKSFVFDKVSQNPLTTTAIEAATFAKKMAAIWLSVLAAAALWTALKQLHSSAVNDGDINDYFLIK